MSRFIVIGISLALIAVAASIPRISDEDAPVFTFISSSEEKLDRAPSPHRLWRNFARVQKKATAAPAAIEKHEERTHFATSIVTAVPSVQLEKVLRYTMGNRVRNDRVVANIKGSKQWKEPQDVVMLLQYPTKGEGALVTYVDISVNQSSIHGLADVLSGGINQHSISILVGAKSTSWFDYSAQIYGL